MKKILKTLVGIGIALTIPITAYCSQITVPSAPSGGYALISTSTGAYIATTTNPFHADYFWASSTRASLFPYASTTGISFSGFADGCATFASGGMLTTTGLACGPGGGSWATTSQNYWQSQFGQWNVSGSFLQPTTTITTLLNNGFVSQASSTIVGNATTTGVQYSGTASSSAYYGASLVGCNSASNALTWSAGLFGCNTITGTLTTSNFATGTAGNIFNIATTSTNVTLNLPFASGTTTGQLLYDNYNIFWNGLPPRQSGSYFAIASTSINNQWATSTYPIETFGAFTNRWKSTGTGSISFTGTSGGAPGYMTVTTPASADVIATRTLWTNILHGYDTIDFDVNFNGNTVTTAGDTPRFGFNQGGAEWIVLTNGWATNGTNGWQHITAKLAAFTTAGDSTPTYTDSTSTPLNPANDVTNMQLRVYDTVAGHTVSIRNIVLSDSTHTLITDGTQPDLYSQVKQGNAQWRIQSVDFMKVSKDNVASQYTPAQMRAAVSAVQPLNLTHIVIDVPYDDCNSYSPTVACNYALNWAQAVHTGGYNVFWRQHWNDWQADYTGSGFGLATSTGLTTYDGHTLTYHATGGIPLGTAANVLNGSDTTSYLALTYKYIINHYNQYAPGDIITPVAEPENAGINGGTTCYANTASSATTGPAYCQFADKDTFNTFLEDNITVVNAALKQIGLGGRVYVGYYGNSANIVNGTGGGKPFIDDRLIDQMQVVTMDDYANPVTNLSTDLTSFENLYSSNRPMVITEFGTINDISTTTRINSLNTYLSIMEGKPYMQGFNYWEPFAFNEALFDSNLNPIGAFGALQTNFSTGLKDDRASCLQTNWLGVCVSTASSTPPTNGQFLVGTGTTTASWQSIGVTNTFSTTTSTFYVDSNRTDSYTADGSIFRPYKSLTAATTGINATGFTSATIIIAPGTYTEQSLSLPNIPLTIYGNGASILMLSGASVGAGTLTIQSDFDFYDAVLFGKLVASNTSLTNPHTLNNSFIDGSATFSGNASIANSAFVDQNAAAFPFLSQTASSTLMIQASALSNFNADNIQVQTVNKGILNLNDDSLTVSSSTAYALDSSTTASTLYVAGATITNNSTGGGIVATNGATSVPNALNGLAVIVGVGTTNTNSINVGSAVTNLSNYTVYDKAGTRLYANGSGLTAPSSAGLNIEGNSLLNILAGSTGLGTSTPQWPLEVASSTANATFKPQVAITDNSAGANLKHWTLSSEGGNFYIGTSSDAFASSSQSQLTITSNGYFGIASTSPSGKFDVAGKISASLGFNAYATTSTSTLSGGLVVGPNALVYDLNSGSTSVSSLTTGTISADPNSGLQTVYDIPTNSNQLTGQPNEGIFSIGGTTTLSFYGEADGSGGVKNSAVGIGTSTPFAELSIMANAGQTLASNMLFAIGSSTQAMSTTTVYGIDNTGFPYWGGTIPTISSCGSTPSGTVQGSDEAGVIYVGGTTATCTLTYGTPHPLRFTGAVSVCTVTQMTGTALSIVASTTQASSAGTGFVLTTATAFGGDNFAYHCDIGHN